MMDTAITVSSLIRDKSQNDVMSTALKELPGTECTGI